MTLSAYPVSSLSHQNFAGEKHSLLSHTVDLNAIWKSYFISPENTLSSPLQDNYFTFLVSWNLQHLSPLPLNGQHDLILYEKIRSSQAQTPWPTRAPTLTTTIQHSFGSFGHSNQSRKRNKRNPDRKRRSKTLNVCRWHYPIHRKP